MLFQKTSQLSAGILARTTIVVIFISVNYLDCKALSENEYPFSLGLKEARVKIPAVQRLIGDIHFGNTYIKLFSHEILVSHGEFSMEGSDEPGKDKKEKDKKEKDESSGKHGKSDSGSKKDRPHPHKENDHDTENEMQIPYSGDTLILPGRIEIENYDQGGEGVAYSDKNWKNIGKEYRNDGVDIKISNDPEDINGYSVAWFIKGEWVEYTTSITEGDYNIHLRIKPKNENQELLLQLNGTELIFETYEYAGSENKWITISINNIHFTEGDGVLRLTALKGNLEINWIEFIRIAREPVSPDQLSASIHDNNSIVLNWQDNSDNETGFILYRIFENEVDSLMLTENTTSYIDTMLLPSKEYKYKISAYNEHGFSGSSNETMVFLPEQKPYKTMLLPGVVEMEYYDEGGQNIAYFTNDSGNEGNIFRMDDVDIFPFDNTNDSNYYVQLNSGEWLEYTVHIDSGSFDSRVWTLTDSIGAEMSIYINNKKIVQKNIVSQDFSPNELFWAHLVNPESPESVIRIQSDEGVLNLDKFEIVNTQTFMMNTSELGNAYEYRLIGESFDTTRVYRTGNINIIPIKESLETQYQIIFTKSESSSDRIIFEVITDSSSKEMQIFQITENGNLILSNKFFRKTNTGIEFSPGRIMSTNSIEVLGVSGNVKNEGENISVVGIPEYVTTELRVYSSINPSSELVRRTDLVWNGEDGNGNSVPPGVYILKLHFPEQTLSKTLGQIIIK